ncbi:hypothetical protein VNO77_02662 [Canavalia gladiata]|uniref:Uncharacterized protein n=1 Tax=Canavalia gladiata TaxID=3824 RepID=A0AAN9MZW4_CANGL
MTLRRARPAIKDLAMIAATVHAEGGGPRGLKLRGTERREVGEAKTPPCPESCNLYLGEIHSGDADCAAFQGNEEIASLEFCQSRSLSPRREKTELPGHPSRGKRPYFPEGGQNQVTGPPMMREASRVRCQDYVHNPRKPVDRGNAQSKAPRRKVLRMRREKSRRSTRALFPTTSKRHVGGINPSKMGKNPFWQIFIRHPNF